MKSSPILRLLNLALVVGLASCGPMLEPTTIAAGDVKVTNQSGPLADRLDRAISSYRSSIGKKPIRRDSNLDRMAEQHCKFMALNRGKFTLGSDNITHVGFNRRALMAQRMYGMENIAENVAGGVIAGDIPTHLTKAWTASKNHSYNLRQDWSATGIGVAVMPDGMVYATQIFATKTQSQMSTVERFRQF